uniref:Uncharacterized protein n=1 Tax=Ipomoea trifida TaxID=35884 RepID=A0A8Z3_IPOTF|nr:hypothetical protein [Ipomoea trifida]
MDILTLIQHIKAKMKQKETHRQKNTSNINSLSNSQGLMKNLDKGIGINNKSQETSTVHRRYRTLVLITCCNLTYRLAQFSCGDCPRKGKKEKKNNNTRSQELIHSLSNPYQYIHISQPFISFNINNEIMEGKWRVLRFNGHQNKTFITQNNN